MSNINNSFTGVVSLSGHLSNLSVSRLTASKASFSSVDGKLKEGTVVGYTPLAGWTGDTPLSLKSNSTIITSAADVNNAVLPLGAVVTQVYVTKNVTGPVGVGATFDIGVDAFNTAGTSILNAVTIVNANLGIFAKPAIAAAGVVGVVGASGFVTMSSTQPITSGSLKIIITYVIV